MKSNHCIKWMRISKYLDVQRRKKVVWELIEYFKCVFA